VMQALVLLAGMSLTDLPLTELRRPTTPSLKALVTELVELPHFPKVALSIRSKLKDASAWLQSATTDPIMRARYSRHLQGFELPANIDPSDPQAAALQLRQQLCTEQNRDILLKGGLDQLIKSVLPSAQPLGEVLESGWSCICSEFQVTSEYTTFATALIGLGAPDVSMNVQIQQFVAAIKALIPAVMGNKGMCSEGCSNFLKDAGNWVLRSVTWEIISPDADLGYLPPLSQLNGLPDAFVECLCGAISWSAFASLLSTDIADFLSSGMSSIADFYYDGSDYTKSLQTAATSTFESAIISVARYPTFLFGPTGLCAGGCDTAFKIVVEYIRDVIAAVLLNSVPSLSSVSSAVDAVNTNNIHGCVCGGTLNWQKMMTGVASTLEMVAGNSSIATSLQDEGVMYSAADAAYMVLGNAFGPFFLCSSSSCKSLTSSIREIISRLSDQGSAIIGQSAADILPAISGIEWCPADGTSSGYRLAQTYSLSETVESFTTTKQGTFKQKLVDQINKAVTGPVKLTRSSVNLVVSPGSINVEADITVAQPTLARDVQAGMASMTSASPAQLSSLLGVSVTKPPTAVVEEDITVSEPKSSPSGSGGTGNTMVIAIGAGVAVVIILLLCLTVKMCMFRKQAAITTQVPTKGSKQANMGQGTAMQCGHGGVQAVRPAPPPLPGRQNSLPSGWTRLHDQENGRDYFYNENTGESTWDKPGDDRLPPYTKVSDNI